MIVLQINNEGFEPFKLVCFAESSDILIIGVIVIRLVIITFIIGGEVVRFVIVSLRFVYTCLLATSAKRSANGSIFPARALVGLTRDLGFALARNQVTQNWWKEVNAWRQWHWT